MLYSVSFIVRDEKEKMAVKSRNIKIKRGFLIGLATVVGGTVIGNCNRKANLCFMYCDCFLIHCKSDHNCKKSELDECTK